MFVIAAMFGVVSAFVTNQYSREGVSKLPQRMQYAAVDAGKYFGNTGKEVHSLLVTNFEELKTVLFKVLDDSGDILEKSLANAIQEVLMQAFFLRFLHISAVVFWGGRADPPKARSPIFPVKNVIFPLLSGHLGQFDRDA